jgi:hypothetical protein
VTKDGKEFGEHCLQNFSLFPGFSVTAAPDFSSFSQATGT